MAEVCAERGYAQTSVAEVARVAGVSSLTFYKQFAGKEECLLAAHRQLLGRLFEEIDRAVEETDASKARVAIRTVLTLLAADAPSARLLTVEILAAGPEGAKRHDATVEAFSRRLREDSTDDPPLPNSGWVLAAGILALIGKLVISGEAARLPELEDELVATVSSQS